MYKFYDDAIERTSLSEYFTVVDVNEAGKQAGSGSNLECALRKHSERTQPHITHATNEPMMNVIFNRPAHRHCVLCMLCAALRLCAVNICQSRVRSERWFSISICTLSSMCAFDDASWVLWCLVRRLFHRIGFRTLVSMKLYNILSLYHSRRCCCSLLHFITIAIIVTDVLVASLPLLSLALYQIHNCGMMILGLVAIWCCVQNFIVDFMCGWQTHRTYWSVCTIRFVGILLSVIAAATATVRTDIDIIIALLTTQLINVICAKHTIFASIHAWGLIFWFRYFDVWLGAVCCWMRQRLVSQTNKVPSSSSSSVAVGGNNNNSRMTKKYDWN